MILVTAQTRILCFTESVDFRKGIDGLVAVCKQRVVDADPFSGVLFLFRNRNGKSLKGIVYDGQGYWLFMKRLSEGRFRYWPQEVSVENSSALPLLARELSVLLWNGDPRKAAMGSDFRRIA
jgi:transposase